MSSNAQDSDATTVSLAMENVPGRLFLTGPQGTVDAARSKLDRAQTLEAENCQLRRALARVKASGFGTECYTIASRALRGEDHPLYSEDGQT